MCSSLFVLHRWLPLPRLNQRPPRYSKTPRRLLLVCLQQTAVSASLRSALSVKREAVGAEPRKGAKKKGVLLDSLFLSNQDGKTIAEKALFYKGFWRFSHCKFRFALLVFEPLTPMYFIKIFRSIKIVCGYTKKSPLNRTHWFGFER